MNAKVHENKLDAIMCFLLNSPGLISKCLPMIHFYAELTSHNFAQKYLAIKLMVRNSLSCLWLNKQYYQHMIVIR